MYARLFLKNGSVEQIAVKLLPEKEKGIFSAFIPKSRLAEGI